jgi:hypothetical protein
MEFNSNSIWEDQTSVRCSHCGCVKFSDLPSIQNFLAETGNNIRKESLFHAICNDCKKQFSFTMKVTMTYISHKTNF